MGGVLILSIVGWPVVEGYQLESIENSQRGFATPLPRWNAPGDKAVVGIFALLIDFFFFVFPLLVVGMLFFCIGLTLGLTGLDSAARASLLAVPVLCGIYLFVVWLSGASAIAKQRYVANGDMQQVLSAGLFRETLRAPGRGHYLTARLQSLPPYLLAVALFVSSIPALGMSSIAAVGLLWLSCSALFYARLVTIQLFQHATKTVERMLWDLRMGAETTNGRRA